MFWKCARQALTALSKAEAKLQMLCEGSLATKNVGMSLKESMKPQRKIIERWETIKDLYKRVEFASEDDKEMIEGEEDILLIDNKAATPHLSPRNWKLENPLFESKGKLTQTKNQPWKTEGDSCTR